MAYLDEHSFITPDQIANCFDTVDHDLSLKKLSLYGIKNVQFECFDSSLHRRQQTALCYGNCHPLWTSHLVSHMDLSQAQFYFYYS